MSLKFFSQHNPFLGEEGVGNTLYLKLTSFLYCQLAPLLSLVGIMNESFKFFISSHISRHYESYLKIEPTSLSLIYNPYVHHSPKGPNTYSLKRHMDIVRRDMTGRQNMWLES